MPNRLIDTYKIARNSIEHFDKLLADFRKMAFVFNGLFISSLLAFFLKTEPVRPNSSNRFLIFYIINFILACINILIWLVEKHYHRYLITSAKVAKNIEVELFKDDSNKQLTYQLKVCKNFSLSRVSIIVIDHVINFCFFLKDKANISSYDFLYLFPILGSIVCNFILAWLSIGQKFQKDLFWASWILLVLYMIIIVCIIRYNSVFERREDSD